jgi:DNA excision repair protein ERCC-4
VRIVVDVHEARGVVVALAKAGCKLDVRRLPVGDYDLGNGVLVERRTIADLRASIADGRLWNQVGRLRNVRIAYFVVEGPDVLPALRDAEAVRGALLAIADLGVAVIRTRDHADTAAWLKLIAQRRSQQPIRRRSPHVGRPLTTVHHRPQLRILSGIPGVSENRASARLNRFGSVAAVSNASVDELAQTPGVLGTLAKRIHESLH